MQVIPNLIATFMIAIGIMAIAILSVQNATPIELKFLVFKSIQIPLGIVLAGSIAGGTWLGIMVQMTIINHPGLDKFTETESNSAQKEDEER